ncbi:MAG: hypothetical protein QOF73_2868 [Thermomicrobiales bacterium]|nr:hypothetical protein [Thermomicrobiales bacterium]
MPFPRSLARINRRITNPVARRFAGRVPPFAIVVHTGRRSGREYRTPVMAFRSPEGFVVALTYGPDADWVRNVLAAGGCSLEYCERRVTLTEPRLTGMSEVERLLPRLVRLVLRLLRVDDFLLVRRTASE